MNILLRDADENLKDGYIYVSIWIFTLIYSLFKNT